ncbi:O-antigen ligase family protein [Kineococcus rhizosphaerae]|uniref:O-antigen ligase-like membrane protein n=1 Tax=Kineococcus rhizosphaerae TaxID=559628 RepID=A0A2T0R0W2_9ACTN|nr:O-antigen ligase family protein [Kineococcus rhizosphaerae]PRY12954.1 O-antigen ligase-like membrane protein [Kineococcus rhizosphaerae]
MSLFTALARTVADPTRHTPHRPRPVPVAWLPVAVVVCAFLFPGNFVVPGPLNSNGTPARLFSLVCLALAALTFVGSRRRRSDDGEPRWSLVGGAVVLYLAAAVWSYGVALSQPLDAAQSAGALRSLVGALGITGVTFYTWMLVRERSDVDRIVGWIVVGATFSVVVGALSWAGVLDWASLVRSTPLVENTPTLRAVSRLEFLRARGTGEHPLEFSLATTAALPLALHLARHGATAARRRASGLASLVLVAGVPLAVSRTAILGLAIAAVVAVSIWPAAQKVGALVAAGAGVLLLFVLAPALAGSLQLIFSEAGQDNSVTGRLDDYVLVEQLFREHPVLGLGSGVYRPETGGVYLDNTWLGTLIGGGAVGVVVLALLFLVAGAVAWDRSVLAADAADRSLNRSLLAVLGVVLMGAFTSDLTSFPQPTLVFTVVLGLLASRAGARAVPPRPPARS